MGRASECHLGQKQVLHTSCVLFMALGTPVITLKSAHTQQHDVGWACLRDISMVSGLMYIVPEAGPLLSPHDITASATWLWEGGMQGAWPVWMGSHSSLGSQILCQGCQYVPEIPLWGIYRPVPLPSVVIFLGAEPPLRPR